MGKNLFRFNEDFIKNYDKNSNKGYIIEIDVEHPKEIIQSS